jgi:hypothetical protein
MRLALDYGTMNDAMRLEALKRYYAAKREELKAMMPSMTLPEIGIELAAREILVALLQKFMERTSGMSSEMKRRVVDRIREEFFWKEFF